MSGGSYDYAYNQIEELAVEIADRRPNDPLRLAFAAHLRLVATAAHDIEWVDSCDYGPGGEIPAIKKVLGASNAEAAVETAARERLRVIAKNLLEIADA